MSSSPPRPFRQGFHDGLGGFYAALHAVRSIEQYTQPGLLSDPDLFDEAVECLARVPGADLRALKSNPTTGGVDQFQIRDLCRLLAERLGLSLEVKISDPRYPVPFARRYRSLLKSVDLFAIIAVHSDGSHWVAALPGSQTAYRLVDEGRCVLTPLRRSSGPYLASDTAVILAAL